MDLDWRTLSQTPHKYWTDQVTRTEMMKSNVKNFTPPVVDTQGSLAYEWYYHQMFYSRPGISLVWLDEEIKIHIQRNTLLNNGDSTLLPAGRKMKELRSCRRLIEGGLPFLLGMISLHTFRSIFLHHFLPLLSAFILILIYPSGGRFTTVKLNGPSTRTGVVTKQSSGLDSKLPSTKHTGKFINYY